MAKRVRKRDKAKEFLSNTVAASLSDNSAAKDVIPKVIPDKAVRQVACTASQTFLLLVNGEVWEFGGNIPCPILLTESMNERVHSLTFHATSLSHIMLSSGRFNCMW
jgi:alpha-tubulin suppressor-like RCC1 family protein